MIVLSRRVVIFLTVPPDSDTESDMKQVLQNQKTGDVKATDVPAPVARPGFVLVRTAASLISAGTERATVEAGQKGLLARAVQQPHLVGQVIQKAKTEGILNTVEAVRSKLGSLIALGYSAAGTVIEVGNAVGNFHVGDRVRTAKGSTQGVVNRVLSDGRIVWQPNRGRRELLALPESLQLDSKDNRGRRES